MIIKNLYDSHIHFLMTGESLQQLSLAQVRNKSDLVSIAKSSFLTRENWITGFGWDENKFDAGFSLDRNLLDQLFFDKYVFFVRADGHSCCVNSKVLSLLGVDQPTSDLFHKHKEFIELDSLGIPNGILRETIHMKVYELLPPYQKPQIKSMLSASLQHFLSQGFTHLRDMTTSWSQWESELEIFESNEMHAFIEHNFLCDNRDDLDRALREIKQAKLTENSCMKVRGVKIFYDGSLGSRTAALSQPYADQNDNSGKTLWDRLALKEIIHQTWSEGFDVSVHTIGDRAVNDAVQVAREVSAQGLTGRLNLEHVQVLKPETIKLMKPLHIVCHLQPCHWLSDKLWLKKRLGYLYEFVFPWESLRKAGIPIQFGSDSPIEKSSLSQNLKALKESSQAGIRSLNADPLLYYTCSSPQALNGETHFKEDFQVEKVIFNGKVVYSPENLPGR